MDLSNPGTVLAAASKLLAGNTRAHARAKVLQQVYQYGKAQGMLACYKEMRSRPIFSSGGRKPKPRPGPGRPR